MSYNEGQVRKTEDGGEEILVNGVWFPVDYPNDGDIRLTTENTIEIYVDGHWDKADPYLRIQALERENMELKAEVSTLKAMQRRS